MSAQIARIRIRSIRGEPVSVEIDGKDVTHAILADPWPVVEVAPEPNKGGSRVTLTLMGDLDLEADCEVEQ